MDMMQSRLQLIDTIADFVRDSYVVEAMYSTGDDRTEVTDIRVLCVPKRNTDAPSAYKKLNYFFASELAPTGGSFVSREPSKIVKKYELSEGFTVTLSVIEQRFASVDGWWRPVIDSAAVSGAFDAGTRTDEDIIYAPETEPMAEPEPAVEFMPVAVPIAEEPAPQPEPAPEEQDDGDEYWDFVAKNIRAARHAINSGSFIRAGEIISLLRHMLIELICVRNGIESNFEHSIDFVDCEEKDMLAKTYPAAMDKRGLIGALSVTSELFDRLA